MSAAPRPTVVETFAGDTLAPRWHPWTGGSGSLTVEGGALRCTLEPADVQHYSDAVICDLSVVQM